MTLVSLVRHGRASADAEDYDQLSEPGFAQARALGEAWALEGHAIDRLVCGPRRRHRETAEAMLAALAEARQRRGLSRGPTIELTIDEGLDEHHGLFVVRLLFEELCARDDELGALARDARDLRGGIGGYLPLFRRVMRHWSTGELHHPDVEPYAAFRERVAACIGRLGDAGVERVVAVTSAGPVGAAVALALELDDARAVELSFVVQNASVTELRARGPRCSLFRFNGVGHLSDPALRTFL